ncbi:hypothetical protein V5T82_15965 [Magnetovibrio sp. PR-2]|uniref:hypothetical protein n=1 Tax=Magnetovibrio sp. PR-2 TaxID=3120356 RepID=UPI002FCE407C
MREPAQCCPGTVDVPLIDVPNPLHHRMSDHISKNHERRLMTMAKQRINEFMVQRQAYKIGWMLEEALPQLCGEQERSGDMSETLKGLSVVTHDICARIKGTSFAHGAEACMTLDRMVDLALRDGLVKADIDLMTRMGEILANAFDPNRQEAAKTYKRQTRALEVFSLDEDDLDAPVQTSGPETFVGAAVSPA